MNDYLRNVIPALPCKNVKESIRFYEEKLGFNNTWAHEDLYGAAFNGNVEVHFLKTSEDFTPSYIYTRVDNVDKLYEFLIQTEVEVTTPPTDRFYKLRECIIRDLNGHYITFGEEIIGREPNVPKEN